MSANQLLVADMSESAVVFRGAQTLMSKRPADLVGPDTGHNNNLPMTESDYPLRELGPTPVQNGMFRIPIGEDTASTGNLDEHRVSFPVKIFTSTPSLTFICRLMGIVERNVYGCYLMNQALPL